MIQTLIGKKIDQTQKFLENGKRVPVTIISVADNAVLQVKTLDKDRYAAAQLGFGIKKNPTKPLLGHSKKVGLDKAPAFIREVRLADDHTATAGEVLAVDMVFKPGDVVEISGISKGKGFAGVVKRHGFRGGPKTHGQSDRERAPGSIGQTTTPGRVYKGKRMAGRMGSDKVTIPNLTVLSVEDKMLLVTGLVPGHRDSILMITKTGERKKFVELLGVKAKREALEAQAAEKVAKLEAEEAAKIAKEAKVEAVEETAVEEINEPKVEEKEVKTEEPKEEVKEEVK